MLQRNTPSRSAWFGDITRKLPRIIALMAVVNACGSRDALPERAGVGAPNASQAHAGLPNTAGLSGSTATPSGGMSSNSGGAGGGLATLPASGTAGRDTTPLGSGGSVGGWLAANGGAFWGLGGALGGGSAITLGGNLGTGATSIAAGAGGLAFAGAGSPGVTGGRASSAGAATNAEGGLGVAGSLGSTAGHAGGSSIAGACSHQCARDETCVAGICRCDSDAARLLRVAPRNGTVGVATSSAMNLEFGCAATADMFPTLQLYGESVGPVTTALLDTPMPSELSYQARPRSAAMPTYFPGERVTARFASASSSPFLWQFRAAVNSSLAKMEVGQKLVDQRSQSVVTGDIDADGDLDIVLEHDGGFSTQIWNNDGKGKFELNDQSLRNCTSLALGDFDGDNDLDVVCPPKLLANDGIGNLSTLPAGDLGALDGDLTVGDWDGDGDLDLLFVSAYVVNSYFNDGTGQFVLGQKNITSGGQRSAAGDLDNDGDLDLVVVGSTGWSGGTQWVVLNDGNGNFAPSKQDLGTTLCIGVDIGDLDQDGDLDIFLGHWEPRADNWIFLNDGRGNFTGRTTVSTENVTGVSLADADGDGDLDAFVAAGGEMGRTYLLLNDGAAKFSDTDQSLASSYAQYIKTGDFDGNGTVDAFISAMSDPSAIWLNR